MRILYFAEIKEIIGKGEDIINIQNATSLNDLIENLKSINEKYRLAFKKKNLKCAVNFEYYGLTLGAKTKELEQRYEKIDAEYKKLIVQEVRERNPVKLLALEERTSKLFKQMREITKELRALIEAEKTGV